jgi:1-acyl-sn-glycerol-3-phosphate acyltransferase
VDETDAPPGAGVEPARDRYGGEHHPFSLIDRLGERVDQHLEEDVLQLDAGFVAQVLPLLDVALRWFDPVVEGFEHLPEDGPFLLVGNHSGGVWMPDYWAFLRHWYRERGTERPIYSLGFDFLYSIPGVGGLVRRLGSVPASPANAARALASGAPVIVYPGGDEENYRPWTERHRVDLHGHAGFVRLALREQVPVVPFVAHGSHDAIIVLTRGEALARLLVFERLRIGVMPIVAGPPWGVAPAQLPTLPLPSKVTVRVDEAIDWSQLGPEAADDPAIVHRCYDEVEGRMQATLDDLVDALPHPVLARLRTASGLDRLLGRPR